MTAMSELEEILRDRNEKRRLRSFNAWRKRWLDVLQAEYSIDSEVLVKSKPDYIEHLEASSARAMAEALLKRRGVADRDHLVILPGLERNRQKITVIRAVPHGE